MMIRKERNWHPIAFYREAKENDKEMKPNHIQPFRSICRMHIKALLYPVKILTFGTSCFQYINIFQRCLLIVEKF